MNKAVDATLRGADVRRLLEVGELDPRLPPSDAEVGGLDPALPGAWHEEVGQFGERLYRTAVSVSGLGVKGTPRLYLHLLARNYNGGPLHHDGWWVTLKPSISPDRGAAIGLGFSRLTTLPWDRIADEAMRRLSDFLYRADILPPQQWLYVNVKSPLGSRTLAGVSEPVTRLIKEPVDRAVARHFPGFRFYVSGAVKVRGFATFLYSSDSGMMGPESGRTA